MVEFRLPLSDAKLFNNKLHEWERFYNFARPHGALGGHSRLGYFLGRFRDRTTPVAIAILDGPADVYGPAGLPEPGSHSAPDSTAGAGNDRHLARHGGTRAPKANPGAVGQVVPLFSHTPLPHVRECQASTEVGVTDQSPLATVASVLI